MIKAFKYRLYPTRNQVEFLTRQLETHCWLYNRALEQRKTAWEAEQKNISCFDQIKYLTLFRKTVDDLGFCNCTSLQQTLRRLDKAFQIFFRRLKAGGKPGYPRFKSTNRFHTIEYMGLGDGCQIKDNRLYLQNIGCIKVRWHRPIVGKIKTLSVTRRNDKWYASFYVEYEPQPLPKTGKKIALDIGSKTFCVDSEGNLHRNPKYLKQSYEHLKRCQQRLARRKKGSKRREKARKFLARAHEKVANQRKDFLHKLSRGYINGFDEIFIEDLSILDMARSVKGDSKYIHKSIQDAGWGMFFNFLSYKAEEAGRTLVEVDPSGTTERCSNCGEMVSKKLTTRIHRCPACGIKIHRDVNAALNILKIGSDGAFGPGRETCGVTEKLSFSR